MPIVSAGVATTSNVSQQFGFVHVGGLAPALTEEKVPLSWVPNRSCSWVLPAMSEPSIVHNQRPWYPTFDRVQVGVLQPGLAATVLRCTPPSEEYRTGQASTATSLSNSRSPPS